MKIVNTAMKQSTKSVPFSDEELEKIQASVIDAMIDINRQVENRILSNDVASRELATLRRIAEKAHKYHQSRPKAVVA